ncbi:MAG: penicillin-binding protein 2 [Nitrospiraceae bacterium]|nr:MAG: penicillin-binding protein 2 [Nitrospiraceae bacterium]
MKSAGSSYRKRKHNGTLGLFDRDLTKEQLKKSRKRAVVLMTVIFFAFSIVVLRLVDLMIFDHDKLSDRAAQQYIREETLKPQRGIIWDRKMREMASNIEADSLYAVPSAIEDTRNLSKKLAPLIKVSSKKLNMTLLRKKKRDFIWLARKMDRIAIDNIYDLRNRFGKNNLGFITESKRYYPKGSTASHLLGLTNIDNKGISGIELIYDDFLKGEVKKISLDRDARGNSLSRGIMEGTPGNNLLLTVDEGLQYIVERELSNAIAEWKAKAAVAIMMDPMTGEILAMANRPTFDSNEPGKSGSYARRNRAVTDLYEPGSTLKTMLAAAALEEQTSDIDDEFDVSQGFIVVGGKRIRDVHKEEILSFSEVIQRSSNVGAVQIGLKLGADNYYNYLRKFGFGQKAGIDFPGEIRGILRDRQDWSGTSLAALSIGQEIGVTPLQILRAYAAIANGGLLMKPYIVSEIISAKGEIVKRNVATAEQRVVSRATADRVKEILKTVVEEGGTAQKANIEGNLVAGKTGTAQIFDSERGRYARSRHISSFVGFAPADDPKVALIVVVYEPEGSAYGGVVAAPVFRKIVEHSFAYLEVPMERNENRIFLVSK